MTSSYTINKTDGSELTTVQQGTVDTSTDLTLIGKNYISFGEIVNENFVRLLENFASNTSPPKPVIGQIWFDTGAQQAKVYDGSNFKQMGSIFVQNAQPTVAVNGDLWFSTSDSKLYCYFEGFQLIAGSGGTGGGGGTTTGNFSEETLTSSTGSTYKVVKLAIDGITLAYFSTHDDFEPSSAISGFDSIKKGFTLTSAVGTYYNGIATSSLALRDSAGNDVTPATLVRNNSIQNITGPILLQKDLRVGSSNNLRLETETATDNALITNTLENKNLTLRVNQAGVNQSLITLNGQTGRVGIKNSAPSADLDVNGNVAVSGNVAVVGNLTAPTQVTSDNSTRVATTAWVRNTVFDSPVFTGNPQAPTAIKGDGSAKLATTAFVQQEKADPTFTGNVFVPTYATATDNTLVASTAYVKNVLEESPVLAGNPQAPTVATGNSSTSIATTAFVNNQINQTLTASGSVITLSGNIKAATLAQTSNDTSLATTAYVRAAIANVTPAGGTGVISVGVTAGGGLQTNTGTAITTTGELSIATIAGLSAGTYGGGGNVAQVTVNTRGQVTAIGNVSITLPSTGVTASTYGNVTHFPTFTVAADGRLTSAGTQSLPTLPQGTYGNATAIPSITVGSNGLITGISTTSLTGAGVTTFSGGSTGLTPSTGTSGAVTLGGTLSVGSGGTGSSSLTGAGIVTTSDTQTITGAKTFNSSGNINFSGTGNVVFSGGKIFINTPDIGIPSAGTSGIICNAYNYTQTGVSTFWAPQSTDKWWGLSVSGNNTTRWIMAAGAETGGFPYMILFGATGNATEYYMTRDTNSGVFGAATNHFGTNIGADLGNPSFSVRRFNNLYLSNSPNVSSDQRQKTDIIDSDLGLDFICNLRPVKYKKTEAGVTEVISNPESKMDMNPTVVWRSGLRNHYGLIAQEVKQALDIAGVGDQASIWSLADKTDPDSKQALNYEEFISPLIKAVQQLNAKVEQLTQRLNDAGIAP